jgi:hypothetical protein
MGKSFDPAKDIGSLEGKVILVTGGTCLPISHMRYRIFGLTHEQVMLA